MKNQMIRQALACSVALGTLGWDVTASAETRPDPAAEAVPQAAQDATAGKDEIVVTAQKRTERLQDVPLAISAFTEATIEQQGIKSIEDYASRAAGVSLSRDSTQASFSVRGIRSTTGADTTSATAGIYVDDYPIYDTWFRFTSPDLRIFDVGRIEILRGPQGTLYGATSLSGSIRIITNKPDLGAVSGKFEGTLSTTDGAGQPNYAANAMVNVPLIADKIGMRAVGYYRSDSGYIDNPVRGETDVDDRRSYGGRFYLSAQPTETLSLLASVTYQHDAQDDQTATYYFPTATRTIDQWNARSATRTRSDLFIASLAADQELGGGNLNFTATYGSNKSKNRFDASPYSAALGFPLATPLIQPSDSNTKILEARYTSASGGAFRYIIGLYYNSRFRDFRQEANQPAIAPVYGTDRIYKVYANQRATELAAYGEGTLSFAERWEATLGLRVFRNDYHFTSSVSGLLNSFATPLRDFTTDVTNGQTDYTPRASLSYRPVPNVNIYATASKGYRFGLTNYNSGANGGTPLTYKSDTLWNYEFGVKATMWDNRVTLNTAAYYVDWSDIQLTFRNANGQGYITNAGDARSYGIESELSFRPNASFELNAAVTINHSALTKNNPGILRRAASARGAAVYGVFKGDRLPGSQELSLAGGIQYNLGNAFIRVDDTYVGPSYIDFMKAGSLKIGDYNLVNLRLGYRGDNFDVTLFAENLFNDRGIVNAVPNADLVGLTDAAFRVRPRTVGATLRANF
ncbi:TonB-dependent receptor [Sphingomonas sp. MG17]|uniref:TonB-dependent receptor n=1 Tax=Sphingomonas tagetis TaxID=2949092 RepID=A0A9X2HMR9_9SPHN|nr:TonB-dependent receptor [Sphingomonas tagetis]MCP3732532.1 TonB-dependent receptor [Sphingomonas tagetis]